MARSFKKHAITGTAVCRSEKSWKVAQHRRWRVALRGALARSDYERAEVDVPESPWNWGKDGKTRWVGTDYEAKAVRK
jgi:hypothetical protein